MAYTFELAPVVQAFNDYIDTDIPNVTGYFKQCVDYTEHRDAWNEYPDVRAMTSVINWKSNVGGSDMIHNFRTKLTEDIHRGDIVYDINSGTIGMITYYVDALIDCKKTQVSACNGIFTITRDIPEVVDNKSGELVSEATQKTIVDKLPGFYSSMYGRFVYEVQNNTPGIIPDQRIEVKLQWNPETRNIKTGDKFTIRGIEHRVMFATYDYVDMDEQYGYIVLTCERVE